MASTPIAANGQKPARMLSLSRLRTREALTAYIFILPAVIVLFAFRLYPVANAFYISLHKWSIIKEYYLGLQNYITLFSDPDFGQSFTVTLFYVIVTVPLTMGFALFFAYLLFQKIRFRSFFRTLFFLPYVTALVPAAVAWEWIFNYQAGILNFALKSVGTALARVLSIAAGGAMIYLWIGLAALWLVYLLWTAHKRAPAATVILGAIAAILLALGLLFRLQPATLAAVNKQLIEFFPVKWLQEPRGILLYIGQRWGIQVPPWAQGPSMALIAVSIVSIWHLMGYDIVIYLAGLGNVPSEMYEAARIDGASESQVFWRITFPMLSPSNYFLSIVSTIGAFRAFTLFYIMIGGGPLRTTTSVSYFVFDRFWTAQRAGYASAAAFVLFGVILVLTLIQQRIIGRNVTYQ